MSEATADEKRAHVLGLVLATARLVAKLARTTGDDLATDTDEHAVAFGVELLADAKNLQRFADEVEAGKLRGRVHAIERALPGAVVDPKTIKPPTPHAFVLSHTSVGCRTCGLPAESHGVAIPPRPPIAPVRIIAPTDYDTEPAPDIMAIARKKDTNE